MNADNILQDLAPFGDIGEQLPKASTSAEKIVVRMVRDGRPLKISINRDNGRIETVHGASSAKYHSSFSVMLASEVFANLRRWADAQRDYLKKTIVDAKKLIPVNGVLHDGTKLKSISEIDGIIGAHYRAEDSTEILLIDGPAGIGKTNLIEQMAYLRAESYRVSHRPLMLHVKSRGRVLSNLQDLMAFSLQSLRLPITYDQVPVLVKHGLVVLAIDGFDELGDPNGYELAWSQVSDLVSFVRGRGVLILAGRDTFIGKERLLKDVAALRKDIDIVSDVKLEVPTSQQAKDWLKSHQWTDQNFANPALSDLLEEDSYALRPVFLRLLGEQVKPRSLQDKSESFLASLLVNHMVERESTKFGTAVESAMGKARIEAYVRSYLHEIARDMADSQTEALDEATLSWISETALGSDFPAEIVALVKNRAGVLAFLEADERPGYRKFVHSQLQNYFLSHVAIDAIACGETPRFVRRNIFGTEFLIVFGDVLAERQQLTAETVKSFLDTAMEFPRSHGYVDRSVRNVGALLFSSLPSLESHSTKKIAGFHVDEAVVRGTSPEVEISNCAISQLDVRQADLSSAQFQDCTIVRLIADSGSRLSKTFPDPSTISTGEGRQISDPEDVSAWVDACGRADVIAIGSDIVPMAVRRHTVYKLLGRLCRFRRYWLRREGDDYAAKILDDPAWEMLSDVLRQYGFLREEERAASGRPSTFYHLRQASRILAEAPDDHELRAFFRELSNRL